MSRGNRAAGRIPTYMYAAMPPFRCGSVAQTVAPKVFSRLPGRNPERFSAFAIRRERNRRGFGASYAGDLRRRRRCGRETGCWRRNSFRPKCAERPEPAINCDVLQRLLTLRFTLRSFVQAFTQMCERELRKNIFRGRVPKNLSLLPWEVRGGAGIPMR